MHTLIKVHSCLTTRDNTEVTLQHTAAVVPVSTYTQQRCIHKYCDFHSWWTAVEQDKSDQLLKNLATHALCYMKIWMTFD